MTIDLVVFDLDGTIVVGQQVFPRLDERVVDYLTRMCRRGL